MKKLFLLAAFVFLSLDATAAIKSSGIDYRAADGATLQGYVAYDDANNAPRPAILILHDWMGLTQFAQAKADQLAGEGYVAFAADIYGKDIRPADIAAAGKLATQYKNDRALLRQRVKAAYDQLAAMPQTDAQKIIVIGYCFGGTAALELARSGASLAGTVSFHGGLSNPAPADAGNIKGKTLVLHGADDPMVPPAEVTAFKAEMAAANAPLQFIAYPGAVHAFTNPAAGNDKSKGAAYNAEADKASWQAFERFLKETAPFTPPPQP